MIPVLTSVIAIEVITVEFCIRFVSTKADENMQNEFDSKKLLVFDFMSKFEIRLKPIDIKPMHKSKV
jgi:hypothetical protein